MKQWDGLELFALGYCAQPSFATLWFRHVSAPSRRSKLGFAKLAVVKESAAILV
jgi:hypothetical protein